MELRKIRYGPFCQQNTNELYSIIGLDIPMRKNCLIIFGFSSYAHLTLIYRMRYDPYVSIVLPLWTGPPQKGIIRRAGQMKLKWELFPSPSEISFLPESNQVHSNVQRMWGFRIIIDDNFYTNITLHVKLVELFFCDSSSSKKLRNG